MAPKSKLKLALADAQGIDLKEKKEKNRLARIHKQKQMKAQKKQQSLPQNDSEEEEGVDEDEEEEEEEEEETSGFDFAGIDESESSDSSIDLEEKIIRPKKQRFQLQQQIAADPAKASADRDDEEDSEDGDSDGEEQDDEEDDEEEEEDDIPMSDLEDLDEEEKEDLIPHQRLTINNKAALETSLKRIQIPSDNSVPFVSHLCVVSDAPTADQITDIADDLEREKVFEAQCRAAALHARSRLLTEGVPFTRPTDYFAELVKSDDHMEKVKAKLVEEATAKKASAEARKLREAKKYGKKVQVAKLQERQKDKREMLDKIKSLKRKRTENSSDLGAREGDIFDVAIDNELEAHAQRTNPKSGSGGSYRADNKRNGPNAKRQKKNERFGFGGKKRHAKAGDAASSGDLSGFNNSKKNKVSKRTASRPGKSKRKAGAGRR